MPRVPGDASQHLSLLLPFTSISEIADRAYRIDMTSLLSNRISSLAASATIAMNQKAADLRAKGHDIVNLSIGEPNFATPRYIQQAAQAAIEEGHYFSYPPVAGYADLRAAIAEKLCQENKIPSTPSQVVVSNGAKQSLANVFLCLLNPGDEVIVYTPYWVSYNSMIQLAGGTPMLLQGDPAHHFEPTAEQLDHAITPRTKAIIFSTPCNPTGHVLSRKSLEAIATVLDKHPHVLAIADEIYEYIHFTGQHTSLGSLEEIQDRVITVNGFSKGFAMTGWRIGYMNAPLWLAQACEKLQGQTTSAPSSIAQRAALAALQGGRQEVQAMTAAYFRRRDLVVDLLQAIPGINVSSPAGAFYIFPDVSYYLGRQTPQATINSAEDLCMHLLQEAHVSLVPGSAFGVPHHIRLSYAVSEDQLQVAIQRMQKALLQLC